MLNASFTGLISAIASLALSAGAHAAGRVVISEIMYNPNSKEDKGQSEWIELANVGDETVEIKGWRIDDEDRFDWGKFSCTLAPGGVVVLINSDFVTEDEFRAAWDADAGESAAASYQVFAVKWGGIANTPAADNEVLQLLNEKNEVVCEVKQEGQWPDCSRPDGSSIYLIDLSASDLSDGKAWKRSDKGVAGARNNVKTEIYAGSDTGSPGYVPGLDAGPIAAAPPKSATKPKPAAKTPTKPAASQPTSKPDSKIDY